MTAVREADIAARPAGNRGALKHLVAPWTVGSERLWMGVLVLEPGGSTNAHALQDIDGIHYTISGSGKEIVGGNEYETGPGSSIFIPAGTVHQVLNTGDVPLKLLSVTNPPIAEPK